MSDPICGKRCGGESDLNPVHLMLFLSIGGWEEHMFPMGEPVARWESINIPRIGRQIDKGAVGGRGR